MAAAIVPVILQIEEQLVPEEIALVKDFVKLFHRKGSKTQTVTVKAPVSATSGTPAGTVDLSSTSLDPDNPFAEGG